MQTAFLKPLTCDLLHHTSHSGIQLRIIEKNSDSTRSWKKVSIYIHSTLVDLLSEVNTTINNQSLSEHRLAFEI